MDRLQLAIVAGATVAAAYLIARWNLDGVDPGGTVDPGTIDAPAAPTTSFLDDAMNAIRSTLGLWRPPAKYAAAIASAEAANGLPPDLLARLLYQESRYRDDIITGRVRSSVGAVGIAQFMPATAAEMGIDPLDPFASIDAAAAYLARLYRSLGSWSAALAAYNWGIGNVRRKGLASAPAETRNYYTQILADVNAANGGGLA